MTPKAAIWISKNWPHPLYVLVLEGERGVEKNMEAKKRGNQRRIQDITSPDLNPNDGWFTGRFPNSGVPSSGVPRPYHIRIVAYIGMYAGAPHLLKLPHLNSPNGVISGFGPIRNTQTF